MFKGIFGKKYMSKYDQSTEVLKADAYVRFTTLMLLTLAKQSLLRKISTTEFSA